MFDCKSLTLVLLVLCLYITHADKPQELNLGFDRKDTIESGNWKNYYINIIGDDFLGELISIYVRLNEKPYHFMYILVRMDTVPTLEAFDSKTDYAEISRDYVLNFKVQKVATYYVSIYASPCNGPIPCNRTLAPTDGFTSSFKIGASSSNSVPFWPTIVIGGTAFTIVTLIFLTIVLYLRKKRKNMNPPINLGQLEANEAGEEEDPNTKFLKNLSMKVNTFSENEVEVGEKIGDGAFGEVFKGNWKGSSVALKKLKTLDNIDDFLAEINMLSNLNHVHIVRLLGIYSKNEEVYIVTEFVERGSLKDVLEMEHTINMLQALQVAKQIAVGMRYLVQNHILHRDLALRNILVEMKNNMYYIKLSDFGLSRELKESYYYCSAMNKFPVKWSAPEVLLWRKYSHQSDVWSFGIVLWELLECGKEPYGDMTNSESNEAVLEGLRLPQPSNCSDTMYKLMQWCWKYDAHERPTFDQIIDELGKILDEHLKQQHQENGMNESRVSGETNSGEDDVQEATPLTADNYSESKKKTALAIRNAKNRGPEKVEGSPKKQWSRVPSSESDEQSTSSK